MTAEERGRLDRSIALHSGDYVERYNAKPLHRVRNLAGRMALKSDAKIADFACGNGMLLHALGGRFQSYDGVDVYPHVVASPEAWAQREGFHKNRFHCCDIRDFCSRHSGYFDAAATLDFSEHVEDPLAIDIYASIRRSLRSGGRLYMHTPNLDFFMERAKQVGIIPQFPEHVAVRNGDQTAALLVAAGFDRAAIEVQTIAHYNLLKFVHPLAAIPRVGGFFAARLWIVATA